MNKILVISYFAGEEGLANSEWVLDKIHALDYLGYKVELLTSLTGNLKNNNFVYYQIPSISPTLYFQELLLHKKHNLTVIFFFPLVITIGVLFELIERLILRRVGHGYWSWTISAILFLLFYKIFSEYKFIYSLGGPPSAHLAGLFFSRIKKLKHIIDFQDHLVGPGLGHNHISSKYLSIVESILVNSNATLIYHMRSIMESAKLRYEDKKNLFHFYTGSRDFDLSRYKSDYGLTSNIIRFLHFGSLYSSRNFQVIDKTLKMIQENRPELIFEVTNIGNVTEENLIKSSRNVVYSFKEAVPRRIGIRMMMDYNVLLLIQHTDERSKASFPFKIWDYLSSGLPILALVNNDELKSLIDEHGHYCASIDDQLSLNKITLRLLGDLLSDNILFKKPKYDLIDQLERIIDVANN